MSGLDGERMIVDEGGVVIHSYLADEVWGCEGWSATTKEYRG